MSSSQSSPLSPSQSSSTSSPAGAPDDSAPVRRLRQALAGAANAVAVPEGVAPREAALIVMSPDFERMALSPGWRMQDRLATIADLAQAVRASALPVREREIVLAELARLSLRVLWWEGLLGPGIAPEISPDTAAAVLIELLAAGFLPDGAASWMVMERAKHLLTRSDVVRALREAEPRRERLLTQLAQAEARIRPLQV